MSDNTPTEPLPADAQHEAQHQTQNQTRPYPPLAAQPAAVYQPAPPRSAFSRHWGWMLAAAIAIVLIVSGGTAWAVGATVADATHHVAAANAAHKAHTGPGNVAAGAKHRSRAVIRGTIASVGADALTIHTAAGRTVRVAITASTAFGTKKHPEIRGQFVPGDNVLALVRRTAGSAAMTAVRITTPAGSTPTATPSPST